MECVWGVSLKMDELRTNRDCLFDVLGIRHVEMKSWRKNKAK